MTEPRFEYDPERALWKPGRRSFLFMLGAAVVAPMLPEVTAVSGGNTLVSYEEVLYGWRDTYIANILRLDHEVLRLIAVSGNTVTVNLGIRA
jgi:hypothetical protein